MAYRRKCSRQRSIVCLSRELSASFDFCYAAIVQLLHFSTAAEIHYCQSHCWERAWGNRRDSRLCRSGGHQVIAEARSRIWITGRVRIWCTRACCHISLFWYGLPNKLLLIALQCNDSWSSNKCSIHHREAYHHYVWWQKYGCHDQLHEGYRHEEIYPQYCIADSIPLFSARTFETVTWTTFTGSNRN